MNPVTLLGLLLLLWALLHFWLLPLTRDHWRAADMRAKVARAGLLVGAEKLRDLFAVGAVAVSLVLALVVLANALGGAGVVWPKAAIEAAADLYAGAKAVADGYGEALVWLGVVGAVAALWLAARQARRRVTEVWMNQSQQAYAALQEDPSRIDAARADPDLAPFVQHIEDAARRIAVQREAAQPDEAELADAERSLGEGLSALAIESARKQVDFPAAAGAATASERQAPLSGWRRWGAVLASERLGRDLGLVRKPMARVVTGLLFVSLVGWAAEPLADSLRLTVNNLRIQLVASQARQSLEGALSAAEPAAAADAPEPAPLQADAARTASRLLAHAAYRELGRMPLLGRGAAVRPAAMAQAEFVRAALAEQHLSAAGAADDAVTRVRAEAAAQIADDAPSPTLRRLEAELHAPMQQMQQRQPARLAALIQRLEARYANPMTPVDAQGKLTAKLLDDLFAGVDGKPEGELAKQAQKLGKDFGKTATKTWADAAVKQFVADTLMGISRPDVVRGFAFETTPASRQFIADLIAREGQGWQAAQAASDEARAARAVADKVSALHTNVRAAERELLAQRLGGYDRLFPLDMAPPPDVAGGGGAGGGGGGPGGAKPRAAGTDAGRTPVRSSAGFHTAARSFRVRGVVIGRDLDGDALDVTGLRWQMAAPASAGAPTQVVLELRVADAPNRLPTWRVAGRFDAGVLNQALRFGADGRFVATTITAGDGREIGRMTYLHPALIDTPLGCRVVEADRWVDTFSFPGAGERPAPSLAELTNDRRQMARWLSIVELAEGIAGMSAPTCPLDQVQTVVQRRKLDAVRFSGALQSSLDGFVAARAADAPGSDRVLRSAQACAAQPASGLSECLCREAKRDGLPARYWFPEDHTSQVRERAARADPALTWLRPSPDRLAHLEFWTHITFSLRDGATGASDEEHTAALDFPPAQLAALRTVVAERLPRYLSQQLRSPSYDDFMAPLEQFVLVQRLARAALAGQLGRDFPLTRLLELERQTRRFVPSQPTIRWEPVGAPREFLETLGAADARAAERYKAHALDRLDRERDKRPVCDRASG